MVINHQESSYSHILPSYTLFLVFHSLPLLLPPPPSLSPSSPNYQSFTMHGFPRQKCVNGLFNIYFHHFDQIVNKVGKKEDIYIIFPYVCVVFHIFHQFPHIWVLKNHWLALLAQFLRENYIIDIMPFEINQHCLKNSFIAHPKYKTSNWKCGNAYHWYVQKKSLMEVWIYGIARKHTFIIIFFIFNIFCGLFSDYNIIINIILFIITKIIITTIITIITVSVIIVYK